MRRFFVLPDELSAGGEVVLTGDEFHHLRNVSRLEEGERVELLDGQGRMAVAEIKKIDKKKAVLSVGDIATVARPKPPFVHLYLCTPRPQVAEDVIQKSAELGVDQFIPVVSDRSFFKKLGKPVLEKCERWKKISLQSCKQSGRAWPLVIAKPMDIEAAINQGARGPGLFLYEGEGQIDIKSALTEIASKQHFEFISLFIGAEGGFSPREVERFREKGMIPATMGSHVLKVETACIAAISVIRYVFDQFR